MVSKVADTSRSMSGETFGWFEPRSRSFCLRREETKGLCARDGQVMVLSEACL